jgi:sulfite oxidase
MRQSLRDETAKGDSKSEANLVRGHATEKEFLEAENEEPSPDDPSVLFAEEYPGWKGYIEWENYPEKRAKAKAILARHKFPPPPEFQLGPIPDTNPVLEGVRWKMWHKAVGGPLTDVPEESWLRVVQEKHPDMLHLLQFPYNGEPPKVDQSDINILKSH